MKEFEESPIIQIAIVTLSFSLIGLNLNGNFNIVFAELSNQTNLLISAEEKTHKESEKISLNCTYLVILIILIFQIGKNTMDEELYNKLL